MAFLTAKSSYPTNPFLSTDVGHLVLACPSVADALILHLFQEADPYNRRTQGWQRQDGRSLTGANRVVGDQARSRVMDASFLVSAAQAQLFEQLLMAQDDGGIITIQDNLGNNGAALFFIQIEPTYLSIEPGLPLSWRRLQFTAEEEVA